MIFSPMAKVNRTPLSPSFLRKRNLPTPPPSVSDINDSSSCSSTSSSSYSTANPSDKDSTVASCDLLSILTDTRFHPVFQAIEEIKRRKCRPDLERILKYVSKRSTAKNLSEQRNEILSILDELLKHGFITKVFHKGGFTIRIKNDKYAKLIENLNLCSNQKSSPSSSPKPTSSSTDLIESSWSISTQSVSDSIEIVDHKRETPSPEFAVFNHALLESLPEKCQMTKENDLMTTRKRNRSQTWSSSSRTKKARIITSSETIESIVRKPLVTNNNLPPVTIEQLLGLRGDIPDVHDWTTNDLIDFFHQQGYEYASIVLNQHHVNGNKLYEITREQVFHLSTLKLGKALKLWNVIEQIQRNNISSSS